MAARLSLDADGHPRAPVRGLETFVEKGKGASTSRRCCIRGPPLRTR